MTPSFSSTQLVPDFVMRSYGGYELNVVTNGGVAQVYSGSAVENNTNPATGELDPAWQNDVSFLGAGVIPNGVWVLSDGTPNIQIVDAGTAGVAWRQNSCAGYAFLLRADGTRELTFINSDGFMDYMPAAVSEPETYAMMLAGLGLVGGMAARRHSRLS